MRFNRVILCIILLACSNMHTAQKNIAQKKKDTEQSLWQRSCAFTANNKKWLAFNAIALPTAVCYGQLREANRQLSPNTDLRGPSISRLAKHLRPWLNKCYLQDTEVEGIQTIIFEVYEKNQTFVPLGLTTLGKIFWWIGLL